MNNTYTDNGANETGTRMLVVTWRQTTDPEYCWYFGDNSVRKAMRVDQVSFFSTSDLEASWKEKGIRAKVSCIVRLVRTARRHKVIISLQNSRGSQVLSLLKRLSINKRATLIVAELNLKVPASRMRRKLKFLISRFVYSGADLLTLLSHHELAFFRRTCFHRHMVMIPNCITDARREMVERAACGPDDSTPQGYVFAVGRSSRDYLSLIRAAESLRNLPFLLLSGKSVGYPLPPNVQELTSVPEASYLRLLNNARIVVVPLFKDAVHTSGIRVLLDAHAAGKPVIIAANEPVRDYVCQGCASAVTYVPENWRSLAEAISWTLKDEDATTKVAIAGQTRLDAEFSGQRFLSELSEHVDRFGANLPGLLQG